jgi:hypothetical protein
MAPPRSQIASVEICTKVDFGVRNQPITDVGYWHLVQRGAKFAVI